VDTPSLGERIKAFADPVQARKDFIARQPMGRLGSVEDITGILVFLASDESLFATGNSSITITSASIIASQPFRPATNTLFVISRLPRRFNLRN